MEIKLIDDNDLEKEFSVTILFKDVSETAEKKILEAQKNYVLPGFRKGSVPTSLIRNKIYKGEVEKSLHERVGFAVSEITQSYQLISTSRPDIELVSFDEGSQWHFKFVFYLFPPIPEIRWEEIEIKKVAIEITEEDISRAKNILLKNFRKFRDVDSSYSAKRGDKVVVDFVGMVKGEPFEGNDGKQVEIVIGEGKFLGDFEDGCVNMKPGDIKNVDVGFPKDYPSKELAGSTATFNITIREVFELQPMGDIAKETLDSIGVKSLEELNEKLKSKIRSDFITIVRGSMKKQLFNALDEVYNFKLPEYMIKQDIDSLVADYEQNRDKYKDMQDKSDADIKKEFRNISRKRVKIGLLIASVSRENNIKVEDKELQNLIKSEAERNISHKDKVLEFYKNPENFEKIRGPILEEKVLDHMLGKVTINNVEMKSEEFFRDATISNN
jgi:trigger factor